MFFGTNHTAQFIFESFVRNTCISLHGPENITSTCQKLPNIFVDLLLDVLQSSFFVAHESLFCPTYYRVFRSSTSSSPNSWSYQPSILYLFFHPSLIYLLLYSPRHLFSFISFLLYIYLYHLQSSASISFDIQQFCSIITHSFTLLCHGTSYRMILRVVVRRPALERLDGDSLGVFVWPHSRTTAFPGIRKLFFQPYLHTRNVFSFTMHMDK